MALDIPGLDLVEPHPGTFVNVLLYGPPKSGKSAAALSIPGDVLYLNADTSNALQYGRRKRKQDGIRGTVTEARMSSLETLVSIGRKAEAGELPVNTIVLDPMADIHRMLMEGASGRAVRPQINIYGDVATYLERFCRKLCEAPINAIFIAHDLPIKDEEQGSVEYLPAMGTSNTAPGRKLMGMVDIVGYTGVIMQQDAGPKYVAQVLDGKGRHGGDRFGIGADPTSGTVDLNIGEWIFKVSGQVPDETPKEEAA